VAVTDIFSQLENPMASVRIGCSFLCSVLVSFCNLDNLFVVPLN
jgi:hypothetical protein